MRKLLSIITVALGSLIACGHTVVYRLYQTTYFGGNQESEVIGTYPNLCECEQALHNEARADMEESMRNGPGSMELGRTIRFCEKRVE